MKVYIVKFPSHCYATAPNIPKGDLVFANKEAADNCSVEISKEYHKAKKIHLMVQELRASINNDPDYYLYYKNYVTENYSALHHLSTEMLKFGRKYHAMSYNEFLTVGLIDGTYNMVSHVEEVEVL